MIRSSLLGFGLAACLGAATVAIENRGLRLEIQPADGSAVLLDKATGVKWPLGTPRIIARDKRTLEARPTGEVARQGNVLSYGSAAGTRFEFRLESQPPAVEFRFEPGPEVDQVLLLDKALEMGPGEGNYLAIPARLGILFPAEGDKPYSRKFRAYATGGGYSMAMFGAVKNGSALMADWKDPYTEIAVDYSGEPARRLTLGLALRKSARSVRLTPLGRGGYVEIAKAYRTVARQRGYLVTLAEKMKTRPDVAKFFGAPDFKPFAYMRLVADTRWNKSHETRYQKSFTFEECADLAGHYKKDLGIDRALLVLNGWINAGYDNKHPDILPAAPEIGGDAGLLACARRVKALGYVFGLHDNYQDMYKDAPSFDESYLMKNADGSPHEGGVWAGGLCWLICSRKSTDLARRPQNIPRVKEQFAPQLYFSDTVFASPPYECFDSKHPLTLAEDIHYKQELCDYLREQFGLFGSEEGREWGVAHADYFEGLMSHRTRFQRADDTDIVIPLFELVFGDAIPLYAHQSDRPKPDNPEYILHHILYAEMPVYDFGTHRYWEDRSQDFKAREGSEERLLFAKGGKFPLRDQYIKNTYEVLSPLGRLTALEPMTEHRFLTADRKVETTRFGNDVRITVNYGEKDYSTGRMTLARYGFAVESPKMIALYAKRYGSITYDEPTLLVAHKVDGAPHYYHAYGARKVEWNGKVVELPE